MSHLILFSRLIPLVFWVVLGFLALFLISPFKFVKLKKKIISYWSKTLLALFRLRVICKNTESKVVPPYPFVLVANHISWIDIFVLLSMFPVSFIAKIEIKKWFFLGSLVGMAGTVFIDRNRRKSIREVSKKMIQGSADRNNSYAFFPEGKTSNGKTIQKFHSGLFSLLFENQELKLLPVLIKYKKDYSFTEACAYVDDMTLIESVIKIIKTPNLLAEVEILPVNIVDRCENQLPSANRKYLAAKARTRMLEAYHR
tara:strand:+ start:532 stop:1299 length:768 start_codon:yes stop_codon:yes gene_type:complete